MTYLYQLEGGGNWVCGTTKESIEKGNYYVRQVKFEDDIWKLGIIDPKDNTYKVELQAVTEFKKENEESYRTIEEVDRICGKFFGEGVFEGKSKVYSAFISQTGTGAPTAKVLEDSITGLVWARTAAGTYTLTKTGAFTVDKTVPNKDHYIDIDENKMKILRTSADIMTLTTYDAVDLETPVDGILNDQYFHIEIFN